MITSQRLSRRGHGGRNFLAIATATVAAIPIALAPTASAAGLLPSTTTVSSSASAVNAGDSVTLTATVKILGVLPGLGVTPTGSVAFSYANGGGSPVSLGPATLGACLLSTCTARITTSALPTGYNVVKAAYAGDAVTASSSGTTVVGVGDAEACPANTFCVAYTEVPGQAELEVDQYPGTNDGTVSAYLGGPREPCSTPGGGLPANFSSTVNEDKDVMYTVLGDAADTLYNARPEGPVHVCYASPKQFVGTYPNTLLGGSWNSNGDISGASSYGKVLTKDANGLYVGLLDQCTGGDGQPFNKPCWYSFNYAADSSPHELYIGISTVAGDPRTTG